LKECSIYSYAPEEDPYDGEDGAIWSLNYFFFNKVRKRVCYIYLRGISILSHSTTDGTTTPESGKRSVDDEYETPDFGARKRARYWLGDRATLKLRDSSSDEDEDDSSEIASKPPRPLVDEFDNYILSDEDVRSQSGSKSAVRAISEEIADSMEV
jgi:hypothetical protein